MAYISYDHRPSVQRRSKTQTQPRFAVAWDRILIMTASLGVWVALVAAARAIF